MYHASDLGSDSDKTRDDASNGGQLNADDSDKRCNDDRHRKIHNSLSKHIGPFCGLMLTVDA